MMLKYGHLLFLFLYPLLSPGADTVVFKSGRVEECQVLEFNQGNFRILTHDQKTYSGSAAQVERIQFEPPPPVAVPPEPVEIDFEVVGRRFHFCDSQEEIDTLSRFAVENFRQPISRIELDVLKPVGGAVIRVVFKHRPLQGLYYETSWAYVNHLEAPPRFRSGRVGEQEWGPSAQDAVSGPWFSDREIHRRVVVKYELKSTALYLHPPSEDLSVKRVRSLLLAIESKSFEISENQFTESHKKQLGERMPVEEVMSVRLEEMEGVARYTVSFHTHAVYTFELQKGQWKLVGFGRWVS